MKHGRIDYDHIQDPKGKIGEDEPVMLFRAQDKHFVDVLKHYRWLVLNDNGDERIIEAISQQIQRTEVWKCHGCQKKPDLLYTPTSNKKGTIDDA